MGAIFFEGGGWCRSGTFLGGEGQGSGLMMGGGEGLVSLFMCYPHSTKKSWVLMNVVPFQTRTHNVEYLTLHFETTWWFLSQFEEGTFCLPIII